MLANNSNKEYDVGVVILEGGIMMLRKDYLSKYQFFIPSVKKVKGL